MTASGMPPTRREVRPAHLSGRVWEVEGIEYCPTGQGSSSNAHQGTSRHHAGHCSPCSNEPRQACAAVAELQREGSMRCCTPSYLATRDRNEACMGVACMAALGVDTCRGFQENCTKFQRCNRCIAKERIAKSVSAGLVLTKGVDSQVRPNERVICES